jgi:hypothetical protein
MILALLLAGCGTPPAATPTDSDTQPPEPPPPSGETPLEWLGSADFIPAPQSLPTITPSSLPDGFNANDVDEANAETPSGFAMEVFEQSFERPIDNQVYVEDSVTVYLYAYDELEGRAEHLDIIAGQDYTWSFYELDGYTIARYHETGVDGRVWISGPYLVVIYSGLDTSEVGPWVDTFASLYLEMFPPQ